MNGSRSRSDSKLKDDSGDVPVSILDLTRREVQVRIGDSGVLPCHKPVCQKELDYVQFIK